MGRYRAVRVLKGIAFVLVASAVLGYAVKWLWNALMPELFHTSQITYWQALGLLVLCKVLFGGFHHHGGHGHGGYGHNHWKERMRERWAHMSDEERERFRSGWERRGRRGGWGRGWNGGWCDWPGPPSTEEPGTASGARQTQAQEPRP